MSTGSSPFVDHKSNNSTISINNNSSILNESSISKAYVSKLEFQLDTIKTENRILQQEKDQITSDYRKIIDEKNQELENLKLNFKYVYDEKNQLESKLTNQEQVSTNNINQLSDEIQTYKRENLKLTKDYNSLLDKFNKLNRKNQQIMHDLNKEIEVNDKLHQELKIKEKTNQELQKASDTAINELEQYSKILDKKNGSDNLLYKNLTTKSNNLQNINHQLQNKIDQLLQNKTSNELLKQQNQSLLHKLQNLENIESKYLQLEIEKLQLETKYNDLFKALDTAIASSNEYKDNENTDDTIHTSKVKELTKELEDHAREIETDFLPTITDLESKLKVYADQNTKLERTKSLREKEITFLRNSLKQMEQIHANQQQKQQEQEKEENTENKSISQYMTNLEKLVDEYKTKIDELEKKNLEYNKSSIITNEKTPSNKRQRLESNYTFKTQAIELEKENIEISSKLKQAESTIEQLKFKISELDKVETKKEQYRILQLKNNLISQDQFIKQTTLIALWKENEELINKYIKNLPIEEQIPKGVFQRQEDDKQRLQAQIDHLTKRSTRLREVFTKKSKDIITVIAKYFGFIIEFLPNPINPTDLFSRIKLRSRYIPSEEDCYLIIDVENRGLKAHGNFQFKQICEELAQYWVNENNQFPCLLSAVNLKLYEIYASK
ncbi:Mitotic checkpoint family protein [Candida albicans]|uniref:Spindle assembly checkpoint component MAD1 n=1 Tax=Candida albicans TaxID=5476 RepID=A0A8H6BX11_CANAX|nr:Mitotic checkpoint family protein [Candida albicans]